MSGKIERGGKSIRPSVAWAELPNNAYDGRDLIIAQMAESSRNLLEDVVAELKKLNALLGCHNFVRIPKVLDSIAINTKKRRYVRKVKP